MMEKMEAALRAVKLYAMKDGTSYGVASTPEQINDLRDAIRPINEDLQTTYGVAALPFKYAPNGRDYWEIRIAGPPPVAKLARQIAHEQSLERGMSGIPNYAEVS
jgi:hypothetical protein